MLTAEQRMFSNKFHLIVLCCVAQSLSKYLWLQITNMSITDFITPSLQHSTEPIYIHSFPLVSGVGDSSASAKPPAPPSPTQNPNFQNLRHHSLVLLDTKIFPLNDLCSLNPYQFQIIMANNIFISFGIQIKIDKNEKYIPGDYYTIFS